MDTTSNDGRKLDELEGQLGYAFSDRALLTRALLHASATDTSPISNERLEFLGDAVADTVIAEELFHRTPALTEGEMTSIRSVVVSRKSMARVGYTLQIEDFLKVDAGLADSRNYPASIVSNAYEAVIGAVFVDGGYAAAKECVLKTLGPTLEEMLLRERRRDFKSILQMRVQAQGRQQPRYRTTSRQGPEHDLRFEVAVSVEGEVLGTGRGKSKKAAEQKAAEEALERLEDGEMPD